MKDPPQKKHDHLHLLPRRLRAALGRLRSHMHLHEMVMQHTENTNQNSGKNRRK